MRNITFNGVDIQNSNIIIAEVQQLEDTKRNMNIQGFSARDGGKLVSTEYAPKTIIIKGIIKGDDASDLDDRIDTLKKNLQEPTEADLLVDYTTGTRRFIATCSSVTLNREYYTIDAIGFEATFVISNPPFGKDSLTTTINEYSLTNTFGATTTGEHTGTINWNGTVVPRPRISMTFNSVLGVNKVKMEVTNGDSFVTEVIISEKLYDGDVVLIDNEAGEITVNSVKVDFEGGFPNWTLSSNDYSFKVIGESYDVDVQFIYYKLWL